MPLVRWVARRRARQLFDVCAGFVYSQVLLACVRLGIFEILAEGPQSTEALSRRLSLRPDRVQRILDAAASLRLVETRGEQRFGLGALGAAVVGNPAIAALVEHHTLLYSDLADPVALLRDEAAQTELARYWAYAATPTPDALEAAQVEAYSALMSTSQSLVADQVLDAYPVSRHRHLLDVGGGDGAFIVAAAARAPGLQLTLFDLPAVAERAAAHFADHGLAGRARTCGGDFLRDALPEGADLVSLVRVLHDHDDDAVLHLLRAVRKVLPDDGVLLVAEPMSKLAGAEPVGDAYFGLYLLAMGSGQPRSPQRLRALLREAGFGATRVVRTQLPLQAGLIVAHPERR